MKTDPSDPDRYEIVSYKKEYKYIPELNMLFPRVYDTDRDKFGTAYLNWMGISESDMDVVPASLVVDREGNPVPGYTQLMHRPTFAQNLRYFINYQLVHMYLRYFMWNFAGPSERPSGQRRGQPRQLDLGTAADRQRPASATRAICRPSGDATTRATTCSTCFRCSSA